MTDVIKDRWERSGLLTVPPLAFGDTEVGTGFWNGVLLPCPVGGSFHNKPYEEVFDKEPYKIVDPNDNNKEIVNPLYGQPKRWPVRGAVHPENPMYRPDGRTLAVGEAKQITVLTLAIAGLAVDIDGTERPGDHFSGIQLMSPQQVDNFKAASQAGEQDDLEFLAKIKEWGLRRLFITGGSLQPLMDDAIRKTTRRPTIGAIVSVHVKEKEKRPGGGFKRIFAVEYLAPTRQSLALVDRYMKAPVFIEAAKAAEAEEKQWQAATSNPADFTQHQEQQTNAWTAQATATVPAVAPVPAAVTSGSEDEPPF